MDSKETLGVGLNETLGVLWKLHHEQCLASAIENNRVSDVLFLDDDDNYDDDDKNEFDNKRMKRLLNILCNIKFFGLTQYGHSKIALNSGTNVSDPAKFWCRMNINELIANSKQKNNYKNNKFINIQFVIDPHAEMSWFNKIKSHSVKVTTCTFGQFPNLIYNELFEYFTESDLIYIILDYLSFDDYCRESSENKMKDNIIPMTMTRREMMKYDLITFHREVVFDDNSKQFAEFDNNQRFISDAYGGIEWREFGLILSAISNISKYWNPPIQIKHPWRSLEETDFKMGHSIDVKFTDEHAETFWTIGTICKVETDRLLIHIPRFRAVWRAKNSEDIAPTGAHTDGFT